jgi:hypothetical protein
VYSLVEVLAPGSDFFFLFLCFVYLQSLSFPLDHYLKIYFRHLIEFL